MWESVRSRGPFSAVSVLLVFPQETKLESAQIFHGRMSRRFSQDVFQVQMPNFMAFFTLQTFVPEKCRETIFAAQLPHNCPHRGGNFERGKNALSCGGQGNLGGVLRDNLGEGNCESRIAARQWGVNFCREASRCLARPSGGLILLRSACSLGIPQENR